MAHPPDRDPLEELAEEFVGRHRRGECPPLTEYTTRHPELAGDIRELFPALLQLERLKPAPDDAGPPPAPAGRPPLERLGDYRILREVGRGGMGVVYEAEQLSLGRHVALKVLPGHALLDPRKLGRFLREARSVARLHHTSIVPVYGIGEQDGVHYYVMQFIQGLGLDQMLDELRRLREPGAAATTPWTSAASAAHGLLTGEFAAHGPGPAAAPATPDGRAGPGHRSDAGRPYWRSVARVGVQVADALAYAHSQGILHRDIKPSNLLLDTAGAVWVTDFGLAKSDSDADDLTGTGDVVGTVRYMAPERFAGSSDGRSDVYALGLTLYELVTLRPAFDDADGRRLMQRVVHEEPPPPRRVAPGVPRDLETVVLKAMAKEPARRYPTPAALADDLRRFLDDKPVRARRVGPAERVVRWCRRNPALAAQGAALLVTLALGVAGVAWKWREAVASAGLADARRTEAVGSAAEAGRQRAEAQRQLARAVFDRGLALAERGDPGRGLHWMVEALRRTPEDDPDLARVVRTNLAAWLGHTPGLRQVLTHPARVYRVTFRPDGGVVATACEDGRVRRWSVAGGAEVGPPLDHPGVIQDLAFSPAGGHLAVGLTPRDGTGSPFQLWELSEPRPLVDWQHGGPGDPSQVNVVTFLPPGDRVASGSERGVGRVWDVATASPVGDPFTHPGPIHLLGVAADRPGRLVSVGRDGTRCAFRAWDADRPAEPVTAFAANGLRVPTVGLRPDGRAVLVDDRGEVGQVDVRSGARLGPRLPHPQPVRRAVYSPDGRLVLTGCEDRLTRVWDAWSGLPAGVVRHDAIDIAVSPDGRLAATAGGHDRTVRVWELARPPSRPAPDAAPRRVEEPPEHHREPPFGFGGVATDRAGSRVVARDGAGAVRLLNGADGRPVGPPPRTPLPRARCVAISPDGRFAAAGCDFNVYGGSLDAAVGVWDAVTGEEWGTFRAADGPNWVGALAFSPDGRFLAAGDYSFRVTVYDLEKRAAVGPALGHDDIVLSLAFSPDGSTLAVGTAHDHRGEPKVTLWGGATGGQPRRLAAGRATGRVVFLGFSPDGRRLLSGEQDQESARLWDVTGPGLRPAADLPHPGGLTAAAFDPAGRLATGSGDGSVRLWDVPTGRPLGPALPHPAAATAVALAPDGRTVLAGCRDGSARLWDVPTGRPLGPPVAQRAPVLGAAFAPDGRSFRTVAADATRRAWPVPEAAAGDVRRLALRLEVRTGQAVDDGQTLVPLPADEWRRRLRELVGLEGTAERAYDSLVPAAYHDARARDAEQDGDEFGAAWHHRAAERPADRGRRE